jgi:hypothetical protein
LAEQMSRNPSGAGAEGYAGSMQSLVHPSPVWGETMAILGLAHRFTTAVEPGRGPILVNGQTLRAFDDEALRRLLGGFVVLDAVAAQVVQERGFGDALGVRVGRGRTQEETAMSYEQLNEDDPVVYGHTRPRLCAQRCATRWHELEMVEGARELTTLCNAQHERLGAGVVDYRNAWGGRVVVLAQPIDGGAQFFMAFFNTYRRKFFEGLFGGAEKCAFGADGTRVYRQERDEGLFIAVLNASLDALDEVGLRLGAGAQDTQDRVWRYLDEAGRWSAIQPATDGSGWLRFPLQVPALRGAFLLGTA